MNWMGRIALFMSWVLLTMALKRVECFLDVDMLIWWSVYFLASMIIFAMIVTSVGEDMK